MNMHNPGKLEFAPHMLAYKENLKLLTETVKDMESQLQENLQLSLLKSSSLVKLNKAIKEMELLSQAMYEINAEKKPEVKEKLLASFRRKLFENQCLLIDEIQKYLMKAAEAMISASSGITMLAGFVHISKLMENLEKGAKRP